MSWTQQYTYEGFGILTGTNGSAVWSFGPATNRAGATDGNWNSNPGGTYPQYWDIENRMTGSIGLGYGYDPWGKRIFQVATGYDSDTVYFYGVTGQKLQTFHCALDGGGNGRVTDSSTDILARQVLSAKLKGFASSNCNKVFNQVIDGYSTGGFVGEIYSTEFYDVTKTQLGSLTQDQVVGNGNNQSLSGTVGSGLAATIQSSSAAAILLGTNFWTDTASDQQNVLLHELLHVDTNWSDPEIFNNFAAYGLSKLNFGSGDITAWISTDCKTTPPGVR